nr:uncharacterized protein LOC127303219 [Lolium perenne]
MKFFMCASYEHDPPRSSASSSTRPPSPPPLCKWFHWIDTEQPDWARQEVEEKHRRAWATFFEEERQEKARANAKAERERQIQKLRAEQARNREVNQKRMDDEAASRFAEEEVRREAREAERKRLSGEEEIGPQVAHAPPTLHILPWRVFIRSGFFQRLDSRKCLLSAYLAPIEMVFMLYS